MFGFLKNIFYTRDIAGNHNYMLNNGSASWSSCGDKLKMALEHPVLNPAINYIAKSFASLEFFIENEKGEQTKDHDLIRLLDNPNPDQSKNEFLENYIWFRYVFGYVYQYMKFESGFKTGSIYNLEPTYINFKPNYKTKMLFSGEVREDEFVYDNYNEKLTISLKDCMIFYDLPNGIGETNNLVKSPSRLDSLIKPIETIQIAYDSKNIVIPQNGSRLVSGGSSDITNIMGSDEKQEIKDNFNNKYGSGFGRSATVVSDANLKVQSLHIPLNDLGLDESITNDAEKIVIGLGLPKDVLKYDKNNSKFDNFHKSKIDFMENVISNIAKDYVGTYQKTFLKDSTDKLIFKYNHLPMFREAEQMKIKTAQEKVDLYISLTSIGVEPKEAANLSQLNELTISDKKITNE